MFLHCTRLVNFMYFGKDSIGCQKKLNSFGNTANPLFVILRTPYFIARKDTLFQVKKKYKSIINKSRSFNYACSHSIATKVHNVTQSPNYKPILVCSHSHRSFVFLGANNKSD